MRLTTLARAAIPALLLALACAHAQAQQAALVGILGNKALLVIDGRSPRTLGTGESVSGIKVVSVGGDNAVVESEGTRHTLRLGDTPVHVSAQGAGGRQRLVLRADARGHFVNAGFINGKTVQYMIDTGATLVALSQSDAQRIGLSMKDAQPVMIGTGNGNVQAQRVRLESVRAGDIELRNVDAVVLPQPMPYILLGNSFLNAFQMTRTHDEMVLEKR
ncbi:retropepsin-like aspartic protease family protein [Diaphorobacter aerolatus]|uniref:Retroviral-like aspartic protease family protein n=1 Tax=Diaphorobacter aerolatus TaxID=1288495 RepID=A0A7H0GLY2_9BURK|nr:retropepsin-like aspartic protease [Diaphorobacter aerolatus]QNP49298.1 retroviral-like aspartic protease family protein [Diaphorobacter aerolatus]